MDGDSVRSRSRLPFRSVEPLGTSRAPPIESITRPGTGVSRQFRSPEDRSELLSGVRVGGDERSVARRSRLRSLHDVLPERFGSVRGDPADSSSVALAGVRSDGASVGLRRSGVARSVLSGSASPELCPRSMTGVRVAPVGVRSRVIVLVAGRSAGLVVPPVAGRVTPEPGSRSPREIVPAGLRSPPPTDRTVAASPESSRFVRIRRSRREFERSGSRRKKLVASTTSDPDLSLPVPSPGVRREMVRTASAGFFNSSLVNLAGVSVKVAPLPSRCSLSRMRSVVSAARSTRVETR